jgi:hypothetical protein
MIGPFDLPALGSYARTLRNIVPAPDLTAKLGGRFKAFVSAPLIKVDSGVLGVTFDKYDAIYKVRNGNVCSRDICHNLSLLIRGT